LDEELKPCPFCGGEANLYRTYGRYGWFITAQCEVCGARSKIFWTRSDPNDPDFWECKAASKATVAWNRRKVGT